MERGTCKSHPGAASVAICALCMDSLCEECVVYGVGERGAACRACGDRVIAEAPGNGFLSLLLVAVGYLAIVAGGTFVLKSPSASVGVGALGAVFLSRLLPLRPGLGRPDLRLRPRRP